MSAVVDTGPVFAIFDDTDAWHERASRWFKGRDDELIVPVTILGEVGHFLERHGGTRHSISFSEWLLQPRIQLEPLLPQDLRRMTLIMAKYPAIGFVDASVVAVAERLLVDTIATTDRRHFASVQPRHTNRFLLVP